MDVKGTITVTVNVNLAGANEVRDFKRTLAHLTSAVDEILKATVKDPKMLEDITKRIRESTAAVHAVVESVSSGQAS